MVIGFQSEVKCCGVAELHIIDLLLSEISDFEIGNPV